MNCLYEDGRESFLSDDELRQIRSCSEYELAGFICGLLDFVERACKNSGNCAFDVKCLLDEKNHPDHPIMHLADFLRKQTW
jgi:hypothetical protein